MAYGENVLLDKIHRRKDEIKGYILADTKPIDNILYREADGYESYEEGVKGEFRPIKVGDYWGGNKNAWFKLRFGIPEDWKGRKVFAFLNLNGEACAFIDGKPFAGLDRNHQELLLAEQANGGEQFDIVIDAISGAAWGAEKMDGRYGKVSPPVELARAELATKNLEVESLWYNLEVLVQLAVRLPAENPRRAKLLRGLNESVDAFDYSNLDEDSLRKSAIAANAILQPLLECKADDSALTMAAVGHSHIDAAWLWPFRETRRKCARTFSTQLRLMEQYPDFLYTQGQALFYQMVKEDYPALYEEIKQRAAEGRWDITGSMWVEADCNLSSGESLVRQVLIGKIFFKDEFGVDTDILWLPDVFGYSAAMPQILSKAGVKYFLTNKIYWSDTNKPPFGTFYWKGLDGSRVLTHFPPSGNYAAFPNPETMLERVRDWPDKDVANEVLLTCGWGDGGGGPASITMEYLRRQRDLEGLPRVEIKSPPDFFHGIDNGAGYREWVGELYLEYHRGTYTTQARNKKLNRKAEFLFREAEILSVIATGMGLAYPYEDLDRQWKEILACQFHDVIPGTSIRTIYEETDETYAKVFETGNRISNGALAKVAEDIGAAGDGETFVVFNSLPWERTGVVTLDLPNGEVRTVFEGNGVEADSQIEDGKIRFLARVPAIGYNTYRLSAEWEPLPLEPPLTVTEALLENRFYRIELDEQGLIKSLIHKETGREMLPEGERANILRVYEDKPNNWPAWDIDFFHADKFEDITDLQSITAGKTGQVSGSVEIVRNYGASKIRQKIVIYADSPRIDFETWVDWHESNKLLKAVFPVDVNADKARYEIQFGNLERPTHSNTTWDFAKFEVCAHKWADLSEGGFGVSLMNDCKYGHSIRGNVMQLSLLRSQKQPDPEADMGEHEFVYSLLPHASDYMDAEVVRRAYELNVPLRVLPLKTRDAEKDQQKSFFSVDAPNVILETVKRAEKGDATILRFYECHNSRATATVALSVPFSRIYECDLMENNIGEVEQEEFLHEALGRSFKFEIRPFEVKTFKLV